MLMRTRGNGATGTVSFAAGPVRLTGNLDVPTGARGIVLYSMDVCDHADSWTTEWIEELRARTFAILCFGLLTSCEEFRNRSSGHLRFDIALLRARWLAATRWALAQLSLRNLPLGYLAGNGSAASALSAAARAPAVRALVCADAPNEFFEVDPQTMQVPTLLLVSHDDRGATARRAAEWLDRHLQPAIAT